jgi:hypothetical protein
MRGKANGNACSATYSPCKQQSSSAHINIWEMTNREKHWAALRHLEEIKFRHPSKSHDDFIDEYVNFIDNERYT